MERTLSAEERIRKAEEIYNRRRGNDTKIYNSSESNKVSLSLTKKMVLQILVCTVIYSAFYLIKNTNYIFSDTVINKTSEILRYNLDFEKIYHASSEFIKMNIDKFSMQDNKSENNDNEEKVENKEKITNVNEVTNETKGKNEINESKINGIGGGEKDEEEISEKTESTKNSNIEKTQMEIDAEYVKNNIKLIKPIDGIITSRFRKKRSG